MPLRKKTGADLRSSYPIVVEIGLLTALALLVVAFRADWAPTGDFDITVDDQEVIEVDEIIPTSQVEKPPPPPKPPVPIEVPDDALLDEEPLDLDATLEPDVPVDLRPPAPPVEDDTVTETEPEIFVAVERMPEPVGGMEAIFRRANTYPEMARRAGVEGRVIVQFVVDENGDVQDAVVLQPLGAGLDEVALEAVKATKFKPGLQRERPVKVRMSVMIRFSLQ